MKTQIKEYLDIRDTLSTLKEKKKEMEDSIVKIMSTEGVKTVDVASRLVSLKETRDFVSAYSIRDATRNY